MIGEQSIAAWLNRYPDALKELIEVYDAVAILVEEREQLCQLHLAQLQAALHHAFLELSQT